MLVRMPPVARVAMNEGILMRVRISPLIQPAAIPTTRLSG